MAGVKNVKRVVGIDGASDDDVIGVVAGRGITEMVESIMTTSVDDGAESVGEGA